MSVIVNYAWESIKRMLKINGCDSCKPTFFHSSNAKPLFLTFA